MISGPCSFVRINILWNLLCFVFYKSIIDVICFVYFLDYNMYVNYFNVIIIMLGIL
jgi:hypothetical protein